MKRCKNSGNISEIFLLIKWPAAVVTISHMKRRLYIIAYDITEPKRLQRVSYFLKGFSTGGQKSVYECFLTEGELRYVLRRLEDLIYGPEDRVHVFCLEGHCKIYTLGVALPPKDPSFFYFG